MSKLKFYIIIKARSHRWKFYVKIKLSLCGKHDSNSVYNEEEKKEMSPLFPKKKYYTYEHIQSYLYTSLRRTELARNG
jgi:hypothetical protein